MELREISSSISYTASFLGPPWDKVSRSASAILMPFLRQPPVALQRGAVNHLLVGSHLLPDGKMRVGKNLVLCGNVLGAVIDLPEIITYLVL